MVGGLWGHGSRRQQTSSIANQRAHPAGKNRVVTIRAERRAYLMNSELAEPLTRLPTPCHPQPLPRPRARHVEQVPLMLDELIAIRFVADPRRDLTQWHLVQTLSSHGPVCVSGSSRSGTAGTSQASSK